MSGREWKPGDVAVARIARWTGRVFLAGDTWSTDDGEGEWATDHLADLRPLIVIDPEDCEEQAKKIASYVGRDGAWRLFAEALRSLIEPPKPEEPTGLGAVVEDGGGQMWVRTAPRGDDFAWCGNPGGAWYKWADLAAVRVLSEGVTP